MPKVGTRTLKQRVVGRTDNDKQVTGLAFRCRAGPTVGRNSQHHPLLGTDRYLDRQCLGFIDLADATALRAGFVDKLAASAAGRAGPYLLVGDITLLSFVHLLTAAVTALTDVQIFFRCGTAAITLRTDSEMAYAYLFIPAGDDLFQRDNHFDPDVVASRALLRVSLKESVKDPAAKTAEVKPETAAAEDLVEVDAPEKILLRKARNAGKTSVVILFALFRVGKDRVGLCDLFELLLGIGLFAPVGMVLERQFSKGVLDALLVRVFSDPEDLVIVAFVCRFDDLPLRSHESQRRQPSHTGHRHCRCPAEYCSAARLPLRLWTGYR